jgi:DNA repair protein RAD50
MCARNCSIVKAEQDSPQAQAVVEEAKSEIKDLVFLKQVGASITRLHRESVAAAEDVARIEDDLSATGSTRTADDIQVELDKISSDL